MTSVILIFKAIIKLKINPSSAKSMKLKILFIFLCLYLNRFLQIDCLSSIPALTSASESIHTASINIINTAIAGAPSTVTQYNKPATFPWPLAYSVPPRITLSIIRYEAATTLLREQFVLYVQEAFTTTTTCNITVIFVTAVWDVAVRYIAVDRLFPYHFNLLNNQGFTSKGAFTTVEVRSYNYNYTAKVRAKGYTQNTMFQMSPNGDYENIKVIMFVSCLGFSGAAQTTTPFPPMWNMSYHILNSSFIVFDTVLGTKGAINGNRWHFNFIVYDEYQLRLAGMVTNYLRYNFTDTDGGEVPLPQIYQNNTIFGFTDFSSNSTKSTIIFNTTFSPNLYNNYSNTNDTYGIQMLPPVPRVGSTQLAQRIGFTLFYLQLYYCPNNSYYLNMSNYMCELCSDIPYCTNCISDSQCVNCVPGYMPNITDLCQQINCTLQGCLTCQTLIDCYQCDYISSYYLQNITNACKYCNNTQNMYINYTSQSKQCVNCSQTICDFVIIPTSPQIVKVVKQGCNSFMIYFKMADFINLQQAYQNVYIIGQGLKISKIQQIQLGYFIIHVQYTKNIVNQVLQLQYSPDKYISFTYNPQIPPVYYSEAQCNAEKHIQNLLISYSALAYIILLFSLFSAKIVGLQLFGVLQLSYFTLAQFNNFLPLYLSPFLNFNLFNGLNVFLLQQYSSVSLILKSMGIKCNFLNNINIMLIIFYAFFIIIGSLVFLIKNRKNKLNKSLYRMLSKIFKQGLVTLAIFNSYNISFSAATHFIYSKYQNSYFIVGVIAVILTFLLFVFIIIFLQVGKAEHFGEFKNKFKQSYESQTFISLIIIQRFFIGYYIANKNQYEYSTLILLGILILFIIYILVNLPFFDAFQNYRTCLIHLTCIYIIFTANYYQIMKSNTSLQIKAHISLPAILQLILIGLCIVVSAITLSYQLYKAIKLHMQNKAKSVIKNSNADQSMAQIYGMQRLKTETFVTQQIEINN